MIAIGPVALLVEDLAEDAGRISSGQPREVDGRFGVTGAAKHAALASAEREHVAGANEVGRLTFRIDDGLHRRRAFLGRDAGLVRAVVDRHGEGRSQRSGVGLDHHRQLQAFANVGEDRNANLPAAVGDHEVDRGGRRLLGGADEIPFILAIFGIDDDDDLAAGNRLDGRFDGGKLLGHGDRTRSQETGVRRRESFQNSQL